MNGAFYIGATGLEAQERALDTVANNIANLNTNGFKRAQARFSELVTPADVDAPPGAPGALDGGVTLSGVTVDASPRIFEQGNLRQTGQAMDIAINGEGFIELMGPGGQSELWRGGTLSINPDGFLANQDGLALKAMISVPAGTSGLSIGQDGRVYAAVSGQARATQIGQIDIVQVKDMTRLTAVSSGLYQVPSATDVIADKPGDNGAGVIVQGSLETSNVRLSDEMVNLLMMQRAFAANAQVIQAGDQLMSVANNLRR